MRGVAEGFEFFLPPEPKGQGDQTRTGGFDYSDLFDFRGQKSQGNQGSLINNQRWRNQSGRPALIGKKEKRTGGRTRVHQFVPPAGLFSRGNFEEVTALP